MPAPPFFVGIGAQRSGTTWLGHYLRRLPQVRFSPLKEITYFDSKSLPKGRKPLLGRHNTRLAVLGLGRYGVSHPLSGAILAYHYLGIRRFRDASYRAYFDELARRGHMAGEISPSYAALDAVAIRQMDALLDRPRYFLILRNPVDRLLSEFSFRADRRIVTAPLPEGDNWLDRLLKLAKRTRHQNYDRCVARYEDIVSPERLHLMLTEDLFDPERAQSVCDGLCDYLGLERAPAPIRNQVNRAPEMQVSPDLRRQLAVGLRAQYRFAQARFGARLPESWVQDLALLDAEE